MNAQTAIEFDGTGIIMSSIFRNITTSKQDSEHVPQLLNCKKQKCHGSDCNPGTTMKQSAFFSPSTQQKADAVDTAPHSSPSAAIICSV